MPVYRTTGTLTGTIEAERVTEAQDFLTEDSMAQYMDESIADVIEFIEWRLNSDGHRYAVTAHATRKLTKDEQRVLSEWVSGQNSDGLGESFEQQDFAWNPEDCGECDNDFYGCECGQGSMISFDWQTNDLPWVKIA